MCRRFFNDLDFKDGLVVSQNALNVHSSAQCDGTYRLVSERMCFCLVETDDVDGRLLNYRIKVFRDAL